MIFFTADTHFGHDRLLSHHNRPFGSIPEMTEYMIESINRVVSATDVLYFIGDFCGIMNNPMEYTDQIVCKNIHLILGNHDVENKYGGQFTSVQTYKEVKHDGQRIVLFHYPLRRWNKDYRGSWMLYGHVHGHLNSEDKNNNKKTLDVGVDNHLRDVRFGTPWSYDEIKEFFVEKTEKVSRLGVDTDDTLLYDRRNLAR